MMEVPQLAVALEAMGPLTELEELEAAGAINPRLALLCAARTLCCTWLPDGRSIIAVRLPAGSSY